MPVELLAAGTGQATSGTITVTAAAPVTVFLSHANTDIPYFTVIDGLPTAPPVQIQMQEATLGWTIIDGMDSARRIVLLDKPGVYRIRRMTITESIGVDRSDP